MRCYRSDITMNSAVQKILLKPHRNPAELQSLATWLKHYKQFSVIEDLDIADELLISATGHFVPCGRWIYQEGDENNQLVYFVVHGEAAKCNDGKSSWMRHSLDQLQSEKDVGLRVVVREGEIFGCYSDERRLESVFAQADSFILMLKRQHYLALAEKQKQVSRQKREVLKTLFPKISQLNSQGTLNTLVGLGHYMVSYLGDVVVQSSQMLNQPDFENELKKLQQEKSLANESTSLEIGDGCIYILVEGSCEISVDVQMNLKATQPQDIVENNMPAVSNVLTHKICNADPVFVIGDEQLFNQNEWNQMTKQLPLRFLATKEHKQHIEYHYSAKVLSKKAKFLVIKLKDMINRFPDFLLEQYKAKTMEKHIQRINDLRDFCKRTVSSMQNIDELHVGQLNRRQRGQYVKQLFQKAIARQTELQKARSVSDIKATMKSPNNSNKISSRKDLAAKSPEPKIIQMKKRVISLHQKEKQNLAQKQGEISNQIRNCRDMATRLKTFKSHYNLIQKTEPEQEEIPLQFSQEQPQPQQEQYEQQTIANASTIPKYYPTTPSGRADRIINKVMSDIYDFGDLANTKRNVRNQLINQGLVNNPTQEKPLLNHDRSLHLKKKQFNQLHMDVGRRVMTEAVKILQNYQSREQMQLPNGNTQYQAPPKAPSLSPVFSPMARKQFQLSDLFMMVEGRGIRAPRVLVINPQEKVIHSREAAFLQQLINKAKRSMSDQ